MSLFITGNDSKRRAAVLRRHRLHPLQTYQPPKKRKVFVALKMYELVELQKNVDSKLQLSLFQEIQIFLSGILTPDTVLPHFI